MKLVHLLHFYQPYDQKKDILERVVSESYLPLAEGINKLKNPKVQANMSAALLQLFIDNKYDNLIELYGKLLEDNKIAFTASAMYHALLPLIPKSEMHRQIDLHNEKFKEVFGDLYKPTGFFPPEMAISDELFEVIASYGLKWVSVPEVATPEYEGPHFRYKHKDTGLYVFARNKRISGLILSSVIKNSNDLIKETQDIHTDGYWCSIMDAETFGHHRIGHEEALFDILASEELESLFMDDLISDSSLPEKEVSIRSCTWSNVEQDFFLSGDKSSFILWDDPENPIHKKQWELTHLAIDTVENYTDKESDVWNENRKVLDYAIASDQFWWASAKPWWSLEMIEQGAHTLKSIVFSLEGADSKNGSIAQTLYREILDQAFEWHRGGYIDKVHQEHSKSYKKKSFRENTHLEWYNQMILEFEDEMNKASANQNFELAIKWRDAILKLRQGTDIFDILHVIDELWSARIIPGVKPFFEHSYEEFSDFAKDNFLGLVDSKDFKDWKKSKHKRYFEGNPNK